jgi:hypothetical protein
VRVVNVHERLIVASQERAFELLEGLGSAEDRLWPRDEWPPMRLHGGLVEGARGGHGPIRYRVEQTTPGASVRFRFTAPRGFVGTHSFSIRPEGEALRFVHRIDMRLRGSALLSWPLVYRPLHDALIEDGLARAEVELGQPPTRTAWSLRVRLLRALLGGRRAFRPRQHPD